MDCVCPPFANRSAANSTPSNIALTLPPALTAYTNAKSPPLDELEELELEELEDELEELELEEDDELELDDEELELEELEDDELDEEELELEPPLAEQEMIVPLESFPFPIKPILTEPPGSIIPFQSRLVAV